MLPGLHSHLELGALFQAHWCWQNLPSCACRMEALSFEKACLSTGSPQCGCCCFKAGRRVLLFGKCSVPGVFFFQSLFFIWFRSSPPIIIFLLTNSKSTNLGPLVFFWLHWVFVVAHGLFLQLQRIGFWCGTWALGHVGSVVAMPGLCSLWHTGSLVATCRHGCPETCGLLVL